MIIDIRGIPTDGALRERMAARLAAALARVAPKPGGARVTFIDENGPKGGVAIRCALTVRMPFRPTVRVEDMGVTPRQAFDGALAVLDRQLAPTVEQARNARRHPKKYYAAKRVWGET